MFLHDKNWTIRVFSVNSTNSTPPTFILDLMQVFLLHYPNTVANFWLFTSKWCFPLAYLLFGRLESPDIMAVIGLVP